MSTPPTEVRQWDEAVLWFLARVPMTKAEWLKLSARARRRAFTVAGVAQADVLHDVFKGIDRAVAKGTCLEEFRKSVGQKLRSAWQGSVKNPAWRLETIYRTNVQHAYSAGRWAQMTDPVVTKHRPFGMFDAILDNRVTERCEELDGTILPWEEWQKRGLVPPLHFNCRSGLRSLRKSQAEKKPGWGKTPPEVASQDGFGLPPQSAEWQPDLEKYPPELRNHVQSRLAGADALKPMEAPKGARFVQVDPAKSNPIGGAVPDTLPPPTEAGRKARKDLQERFPDIILDSSLDAVDAKLLKSLGDEIASVKNRWPDAVDYLKVVTAMPALLTNLSHWSALRSGSAQATLVLNPWSFANVHEFSKEVAEAGRRRWFPGSFATPRGVLVHELGHLVLRYYERMSPAEWDRILSAIKGLSPNGISRAARRSQAEALADAFVVAHLTDGTPRNLYAAALQAILGELAVRP